MITSDLEQAQQSGIDVQPEVPQPKGTSLLESPTPAPSTVENSGGSDRSWFDRYFKKIVTLIVIPSLAFLGKTTFEAWIKSKEQAQAAVLSAEVEKFKIEKSAEVAKEQLRLQWDHEDALRQQGFQHSEQQQSAVQRQRILTFYSAVLAKLDQADGVWSVRPTLQSKAVVVQFERERLLPIYAETQKLIAENMELVSLNSAMRQWMAEFGRDIATYEPGNAYSNPHYSLRYHLQWAVQTLSQQQ